MPDEELPDVRRDSDLVEIASNDSFLPGFIWLTRRQAEYVADELARILAEDWS